MQTLDDLLPDYDVCERHQRWVADASVRRAFRRYWLVVAFSTLIRRRRLAAADRALR